MENQSSKLPLVLLLHRFISQHLSLFPVFSILFFPSLFPENQPAHSLLSLCLSLILVLSFSLCYSFMPSQKMAVAFPQFYIGLLWPNQTVPRRHCIDHDLCCFSAMPSVKPGHYRALHHVPATQLTTNHSVSLLQVLFFCSVKMICIKTHIYLPYLFCFQNKACFKRKFGDMGVVWLNVAYHFF